MAKSRKRKPSFDDPGPPTKSDGQTGWVYRSTPSAERAAPARRKRPASQRRRTGGAEAGPPPVTSAATTPVTTTAADKRGLLECGADLVTLPFAFGLIVALVPLTWFKGHATDPTH